MTILSKNNTGMHNLFRMSSLASLEGQLGKWPRMDRELLSTYAEGLIATSGCPSGEVQVRLRLGQWEEAVRAAADMQDIFGKERSEERRAGKGGSRGGGNGRGNLKIRTKATRRL